MKKYWIMIGGLLMIIWACAPRPAQPSAKPSEEEVVIIGEEEAPTIEEAPTVEEGEVSFEKATPSPSRPAALPSGSVYGYRVQILASSIKENAEKFAAEAQARFPNLKVYVEFIPPYYKVRVGDFLTREEAETFKAKARSLGYFDAFIVESQINPPK